MDDRRFDNVARSLASLGSRRALVGALLGGGAAALASSLRLPGAMARRNSLGAGDPCRHDDQCVAADTALYCDWNGFGYDGQLNCCAYAGSRCSDDSGCCGYSVCAGGWCTGGGASAGSGGIATADAQGGSVSIGNINSGGNVGNTIRVGNTSGNVAVDGGFVSNDTSIAVDAGGGQAIADASGGSGNIAGGPGGPYVGPDPGPGPDAGCTGYGCTCDVTYGDPCDSWLLCCLYAGSNQGMCLPLSQVGGYCGGGLAPGWSCPDYCTPGPAACPSCSAGYCTEWGYCGS